MLQNSALKNQMRVSVCNFVGVFFELILWNCLPDATKWPVGRSVKISCKKVSRTILRDLSSLIVYKP